jgi:hypothetical protein
MPGDKALEDERAITVQYKTRGIEVYLDGGWEEKIASPRLARGWRQKTPRKYKYPLPPPPKKRLLEWSHKSGHD